jgi:hypothetical protein
LGYSRPDEQEAAFEVDDLPSSISPRTVVALATRANAPTTRNLYSRFLCTETSSDDDVLEFVLGQSLDASRFGTSEWSPDLGRIRACYAAGAGSVGFPFTQRNERKTMPFEIASEIAGSPDLYPTPLLAMAEEVCRRNMSRKAKPVVTIADEEGWFGQQRPGRLFEV